MAAKLRSLHVLLEGCAPTKSRRPAQTREENNVSAKRVQYGGVGGIRCRWMLPVSSHAQNAQQRPPAAEKPAAPGRSPPKSMKEAILGSWSLLIDDAVKPDGTHAPNFGPNPEGIAMFGADGHFAVAITRAGRPKFASNNRATGTGGREQGRGGRARNGAILRKLHPQRGRQDPHASRRGQHIPELGRDGAEIRTITPLTAGDELDVDQSGQQG